MVIVVDPRRRRVIVERSSGETQWLSENDSIDGSDVVPGWRLAARAIFE